MIAITTVAVIALLFMAWRKHAWSIAVLGVVVGVTIGGPIAQLVNAGVAGAQTAVTTVDTVVKTTAK